MKNASRIRSFTLMELLLVVIILSVIAVLFITMTGDIGNVSIDAASWKIQSDIRYAHQLAMQTGRPHGVKFTSGGNYVVYDTAISNPVADPLKKTPLVDDLTNFQGIAISNNFQVEFNSQGFPQLGGGGNVLLVAAGGAERRINVAANTGAVVEELRVAGTRGCGGCSLCFKGGHE